MASLRVEALSLCPNPCRKTDPERTEPPESGKKQKSSHQEVTIDWLQIGRPQERTSPDVPIQISLPGR
jgi:hypothetical protein